MARKAASEEELLRLQDEESVPQGVQQQFPQQLVKWFLSQKMDENTGSDWLVASISGSKPFLPGSCNINGCVTSMFGLSSLVRGGYPKNHVIAAAVAPARAPGLNGSGRSAMRSGRKKNLLVWGPQSTCPTAVRRTKERSRRVHLIYHTKFAKWQILINLVWRYSKTINIYIVYMNGDAVSK